MHRQAENEVGRERRSGNDLARSTRRKNLVLLAILVLCVVVVFALGIAHIGREAAGVAPVEQE